MKNNTKNTQCTVLTCKTNNPVQMMIILAIHFIIYTVCLDAIKFFELFISFNSFMKKVDIHHFAI